MTSKKTNLLSILVSPVQLCQLNMKEGTLKEYEIVEFLKKENEEFRRLSEEHRNLDRLLIDIDNRRYLSPEEEVERKKLQKQKLLRKDKMAAIVRQYKKNQSLN